MVAIERLVDPLRGSGVSFSSSAVAFFSAMLVEPPREIGMHLIHCVCQYPAVGLASLIMHDRTDDAPARRFKATRGVA